MRSPCSEAAASSRRQTTKHAAKLRAAVRQRGSKLGPTFEADFNRIQKALARASAHVAALAVKLSTDSASPARLHKRNFDPYRLEVKELRNVLQMAENADQ